MIKLPKILKWLDNPVLMPACEIHKIECIKVGNRWRVSIVHMIDDKESLRVTNMADTVAEALEQFSRMMK